MVDALEYTKTAVDILKDGDEKSNTKPADEIDSCKICGAKQPKSVMAQGVYDPVPAVIQKADSPDI